MTSAFGDHGPRDRRPDAAGPSAPIRPFRSVATRHLPLLGASVAVSSASVDVTSLSADGALGRGSSRLRLQPDRSRRRLDQVPDDGALDASSSRWWHSHE